VPVIQIPQERMVGSRIAGSLIHAVGHQGLALLLTDEQGKGRLTRAECNPVCASAAV